MKRPILYILTLLLLSSCGVQRTATVAPTMSPERLWVRDANLQLQTDNQQYQCAVDIRLVKDSAMSLSIYAMPGMEIARVQATPDSVVAVDKFNRRYTSATWNELRSLVGAQLPTYEQVQTRLLAMSQHLPDTWQQHYQLGGHEVEFNLSLPLPVTDRPVQIRPLKTANYDYLTITELLQLL